MSFRLVPLGLHPWDPTGLRPYTGYIGETSQGYDFRGTTQQLLKVRVLASEL